MGILYFIQPAELVGTNRFKVGCSTKNDLSRVKSYKAGTRMIMILQCEDPFLLEQKVLVEFKTQFHKIAGNEYFEGDESVMRKVFYDTYLQWEHHKKDGIAKWSNDKLKEQNDKLKEQNQRLAQLHKDLEILREDIVQGEAYLDRVVCGEEDDAILAQHQIAACAEKNVVEKTDKHRQSSLTECFKMLNGMTGELSEKRKRTIITRPPLEGLIKSKTHFRFTHKGIVSKCFTTNGTCFIDERDQKIHKSLASWTVAVIEKGGGGGRKVSVFEVCEVFIAQQWKKWGDVYTPNCTFIH